MQKVLILFGVIGGLGLLGGCSGGAEKSGASVYRDDFAEVFGSGAPAERASREPWAIVLGVFSGEGAQDRAEASAGQLRETLGLASARAEPRSRGAVVVFGGYAKPEDRAAQQDLKRLQALEIEGVRPFRTAFLAPQGGPAAGSHPLLNLNNAKANHGEGAKYTLQIAVYESDDRSAMMEAAERATVDLRQEGELAFYYHGPTKSMVTVGLFGDRDYDPRTDQRSSELQRLQQRYPYNLLNGRTIIEKRRGGERTQPSSLVQVPGG